MRKLLISALLVMLLAGCGEPAPVDTRDPSPSASPAFASDEEALAAAVEAYGAYLAVSDAIAADGGQDPERLAPLVSEEWLAHEVQVFETFQTTGNKQIGSTSIGQTQLQQYNGSDLGIYVCLDFTSTSFIDSTGLAIPPSEVRAATVEATFEVLDSGLILVGSEPWPESIC